MKRPFFKKSIKELEEVFAQNGSDAATLENLTAELKHRTTQRAQSLQSKVLKAAKVALPKKSQKMEDRPKVRVEPPIKSDFSQTRQPDPPVAPSVTRVDLGPKPEVTNAPENILRSWTALEVLSPQGYKRETDLVAGDKYKIARLDDNQLPWERGERSKPKKRLFYELMLGAVELSPAVESLLKLYADKRPDKPSMKGRCPVASILLDKEGKPLEEDTSFAISSFAWGVPIALDGDLKELASWPVHEKSLTAEFKKLLIRYDRDGEIIPLTKQHIEELFDFLSQKLKLNRLEVTRPYFALRRYEYFASKTPPEPTLLNSFYLEDLAAARRLAKDGTLPNALKHYLGIAKPSVKTNLLDDNAGLQKLLQPALTPLGRWPGNGRFPLALLQQAAVNAASPNLMETGILAVNGPPGTGKTTLLRDVVAARIIERATAMSSYKKPSDAFRPTSQTLQRNGAKITLHKLDEQLKGFEMVVTSSNNKAVENVSAELPAMGAVAADAPDLRYFKSISDNVLERETWGSIAAVLGNSSNRFNFSQRFWRDDENGLSTYLNHASGVPQIVSEPQENGPPQKRNRRVIDTENPPSSPREAATRWEKARSRFLEARRISEQRSSELQKAFKQIERLVSVITSLDDKLALQPAITEECQALEERLNTAQPPLQEAEQKQTHALRALARHAETRPGFFARLFQRQMFTAWKTEHSMLDQDRKACEAAYANAWQAFDELKRAHSAKKNELDQIQNAIAALENERDQLNTDVTRMKAELDVDVPDADFLGRSNEEIQVKNVWFDKAASRLRDDVFEAAIQLHRAFIDAAADPMRQNISVFVESFGTRSMGTPQKDALIADLWATFFLVVPVVSTTFASVHRMFSRLAPEALGWLLVDEAGQAVPQASVGAMMRTKRSVVVGDPLQIEPVVTLPNSLTEEICAYFGIDPLRFNAPEASIQTVADAASMFYSRFPTGSGHREVGAPLLVHRRCNDPMFSVSNEIAYSNLMVQAKAPSQHNETLGPSAWVDVVGKAGPDKWCADEATTLIAMLRQLKASGTQPDLYVVTPFVIVQDNLRREIVNSGILDGWVHKPREWVREHVGTVHTVQGREAKIVFFVLGAQMSSQNGARAWAGSRPNLVNVAVTRAKESLYVIGNRQLWKSAGVFAVLDRHLPQGPQC
ncbi:hypothetical protein D1821_06040 [Phaeobacter inhibens]|uniref:AAA domain-containing protein n=1 Tax=Phaeobacter inhibens TaxID=221822 RepID=UPI000160E26D|nr:AAA domain-containing protein [Phaeobacter inhibens]AFO87177.1 hypothetical protein PGA2_c11700 [Phaeobacter inhibens 2.10]AXT41982.1 hypothetical protein D1821_06040 [Phaeobacter inhibens]